jgi:hypothetical protein
MIVLKPIVWCLSLCYLARCLDHLIIILGPCRHLGISSLEYLRKLLTVNITTKLTDETLVEGNSREAPSSYTDVESNILSKEYHEPAYVDRQSQEVNDPNMISEHLGT